MLMGLLEELRSLVEQHVWSGMKRKDGARVPCNLGSCNGEQAELWAQLLGLEIAWAESYKKVQVETDSKPTVALIKKNYGPLPTHNVLIKKCLGLIGRDWEVIISHIYMEVNEVVDGLSKWVLTRNTGLRLLASPPSCVLDALQSNMQGYPRYR